MNTWSLADLLPHAGKVILLSEVLQADANHLVALAIVPPDSPYHDRDGTLPPWMGLEILAQAVAAWSGYTSKKNGRATSLGFLLGTRRYDCHIPAFHPGQRLIAQVNLTLENDVGIGMFECVLLEGTNLLAQASLKLFRPDDIDSYLQESAFSP